MPKMKKNTNENPFRKIYGSYHLNETRTKVGHINWVVTLPDNYRFTGGETHTFSFHLPGTNITGIARIDKRSVIVRLGREILIDTKTKPGLTSIQGFSVQRL